MLNPEPHGQLWLALAEHNGSGSSGAQAMGALGAVDWLTAGAWAFAAAVLVCLLAYAAMRSEKRWGAPRTGIAIVLGVFALVGLATWAAIG